MKEENLMKQVELSIIEKMGIAYGYCKILLNSNDELEDFIFIECNDCFEQLTGFPKEYIVNKRINDISAFKTHRENILNALKRLLYNEEHKLEFEDFFQFTKKWIKVLIYTFRKDQFLVTFYDISKYKIEEIKLRNSENQYKSLIELATDAIIIRNLKGNILYSNKSALNLFGYTLNEMKKLNMIDLISKSMVEESNLNISIGDKPTERIHKRKDGTHFYSEEITKLINMKGELCVVSYIRDITERKIHNDRTKQMAYFDSLTELPNRNSFLRELDKEIKNSTLRKNFLAIMFLDLDKFKDVNDNFGHAVGDKLLWQVAKRIQQVLSSKDLIARFGGDEFTILIRNVLNEKQVEIIANKITEVFKKPIELDGQFMDIKTSIGVSFFPKHGDNSEELIKNADKAMYSAKNKGRNKFEIYTE